MNTNRTNWFLVGGIVLIASGLGYFAIEGSTERNEQTDRVSTSRNAAQFGSRIVTAGNNAAIDQGSFNSPLVQQAVFTDNGDFQQNGDVIRDSNIRLCQGHAPCTTCAGGGAPNFTGQAAHATGQAGFTTGQAGFSTGQANYATEPAAYPTVQGSFAVGQTPTPTGFKSNVQPYAVSTVKHFAGVDENTARSRTGEAIWKNADMIPWEAFAYGEYIGPHRHPHVAEYRLRVDDSLEFVYILTRERSTEPYRFYVGDTISITSAIDDSINQDEVSILGDGTISLSLIGQVRVAGKTIRDLQRELNDRYAKYFQNPSVVVQVLEGETPLRDLLDSVDARAGQGGQSRDAVVSPDGTIQLPLIGNVPAIGLTLKEIAREVNARYRTRLRGVEVTPVLTERAPRFIYVIGEVAQPGQFELTGPTTSLQAIALAGGNIEGGNLRQIVVFRRDQNFKLMATKLDLAGALFGKRPHPSDEIWLRDSDIVLIPPTPILRFSEQVQRYLVSTLYAIFPQQGVAFDFDDFTSL